MTLYLYRIGTEVPVLTIENVQNYTADSVTAKNAKGNPIVYSPLSADCELSSKADCSETLRAAWREEHPEPPTNEELAEENKLLKQQVSALTEQQSFYEDCIAEMATVVYA